MVGNQVAVGSPDAVPNRVIHLRNPTHSPAAGRRPDLRDKRTVPGQLDLSCNVGRLMLKSASLPLSRSVRVRQRAAPGRDGHARAAAFKGLGLVRTGADDGGTRRCKSLRAGGGPDDRRD
jgi:hypothetical protein